MGRAKARKHMKLALTNEGFNNLLTELKAYRSNIAKANDLFVRRLAEAGFDRAQIQIQSCNHFDRDKPIGNMEIFMTKRGEIAGATLKFSGEQVLFIEFGAGFMWNTSIEATAYAEQYGYGVGTYPHQVHANDPSGWSYQSETGKWIHTYGTEATMPMFHAGEDMINKFIEIAREVYQSVL